MNDLQENGKPLAFNYGMIWSQIEQEATRKLVGGWSRRDFIKLMGLSIAAATVARFGSRPAVASGPRLQRPLLETGPTTAPSLPNGVASGDVTQSSAVLWARCTELGRVRFEVSSFADFTEGALIATAVEVTDPTIPVKKHFQGLESGMPYYYRVTSPNGDQLVGRFTTPAIAGRSGLRFGVSGDWRGELRPYVAVSNAIERDLAFFVAMGDTIYADYPTEAVPDEQCITLEQFRAKHAEIYTELDGLNYWADLRAAMPLFATIDDHEVTNDFSGGADPGSDPRFAPMGAAEGAQYINQTSLYRNGLETFLAYHPLVETIYENTGDSRMDGRPNLYRYQTFGSDAAIYMLDARSFRDQAVTELPTLSIFSDSARQTHIAKYYAEGRTMLGRTQVDALKRDLLAAQTSGVMWKFVMIPEPAQNTGWFGGNDRWEGYAPERTEVMKYIEDNGIRNVVFVAADVHSTFINRLFYQTEPLGTLNPVSSFEVTTGSVAFFPPTGAALAEGAAQFNLIPRDQYEVYQQGTLAEQDAILEALFNRYITELEGFGPMTLEGTNARLVEGGHVLGHSFGWTEFEIDADSGELTITTYGIRAYSAQDLATNRAEILSRVPQVLSVIKATPAG
jgi:phosphodiesterase/alkaline phosphatase D-like protein